MPKPTPEKVITQKHRRLFIQWGGPRPNNRRYYGGVDGQEMAVGDDSNPISGGINPIRIHDPNVIGRYKNVGRTIDPPDLPTVPVMFYIDHGGIPRSQINRNCPFNVYEVVGKCATLSDFNGGWESFVKVYSYLEATDDSGSGNFNFDSDEASMIEWDTTAEAIYYIGAIGMGQKASTQVDRNVVDIVYGTRIQCGDCGPTLDGTDWIYAITDSSGTGSPGLPAELIYTVDGGGTWTEVSIDGLGADDSPSAIDIIGNYLVVLSNAAGSMFVSEINNITGVPGTFTAVAAGFVTGGEPNDLYIDGNTAYIVGDGGYIYQSSDILSGVTVIDAGDATSENLNRIHGSDTTLMATGANGALVLSTNSGETWAIPTVTPFADAGTAIFVLDNFRAWIGSDGGQVFYTLNGGESWIEQNFSGSGSGQVNDIVFATDETGFISHSAATPTARLLTTMDGGETWGLSTQAGQRRITNWPTFDQANRIAVPLQADINVLVNNIAIAGLAGDGTDGVIYLGVASFK